MNYSIFTIYILNSSSKRKKILLFVRYLSPSQPLLRVYTWLKLYSDQHSLMYTIIYPIFSRSSKATLRPLPCQHHLWVLFGSRKSLKQKKNSQSTLIMWKILAKKVTVKISPHKKKKEEKNQTVVPGIPLFLFLFDSLCIPKKIFPSI